MSAEENKVVAREFVLALIEKRRADVLGMVADDATWWINGSLPFSGVHTVKQIFGGSDQIFKSATSPTTGGIGAITAEEDRVAVESWAHQELGEGRVYHNEVHMLLTFRDGKVASVKEYGDTELLNRLFGEMELDL